MSVNDGGELTVEEAAEKLRSIKSSAGADALREFFQTGGGLLDFEQSDLWRDVSLAIIRPSQNLSLEIEQFRALIHRIRTPASERFGTLRAVPGTEEEAQRREGELSGVRIGAEGLLDDDLEIDFEGEASALRRFVLEGDGVGGLSIGLVAVKDIPTNDVRERVRAIAPEAVFLEDLDEGQQFGTFQTNEAGDELAVVQLSAGAPVRTDDVGDLVRRIKQADPGTS